MIEETIHNAIVKALVTLGVAEGLDFVVEVPADLSHGDLATNVAMIVAKEKGSSPRKFAEELKEILSAELADSVSEITIAGAGFINFHLARTVFKETLEDALKNPDTFGKNETKKGTQTMVEYTDPNVMKPFHVGHLMSNTIGESFSRLIENSGAEVQRANYFSDVGIGIAKAVWGIRDLKDAMPDEVAPITDRTDFLGHAYVHGVTEAEKNIDVAEEVKKINKALYEKSDPALVELYTIGRRWSIEHFTQLYALLGSTFDYFYPESDVAKEGKEIVLKALGQGVFEKSEGAVVFHGQHTRVFINSEGLPTYEAKELALNKKKFADVHTDTDKELNHSIVITASEQDAYFKVVLEALRRVLPTIAERTQHVSHGMMRFAEGKMSSRTGNVITGESLLNEAKEKVLEKMDEKNETNALAIALGAVKYSILKQGPGKNIVFDVASATSLEGDSGPYLQYSYVRTKSLLEKGREEGISPSLEKVPDEAHLLERILFHFEETAQRAGKELQPQQMVQYLLSVASTFNTWYAQEKIVDVTDEFSPHKLALTKAVGITLKRGLWLLGIPVPERM
jgi:arginyl-tRNA synthetase